MLLPKVFSGILTKSADKRRVDAYREAIQEEAKVGGRVFGEIPKGTRREFFCLDEHTWVWHEEWNDEQGRHQVRTTRYDIRPQGVFKAQDGQPYRPLQKEEARRLLVAMRKYNELIDQELAPYLPVKP
ncbi:hypothetical protein IPL85_00720 [Candidatus Saccharibacteria bacterium]|nr:MAG: hypothetical protein IPL85_00720 [Candidatus Saccharibacteria bacterium]